MDASALELSKENIQPLKQGRKAGQLGLALQAQTDTEVQQQLLKERDYYELLIRMDEGPDPLALWCDYVAWVEQMFPKHGPDAQLVPLLENTIATFKDDERYKQDPRFAQLIVKYIEWQVDQAELYQMIFSQGLATGCAIFYKSWANLLDSQNDLKRADQIFQLGISNNAQPKELLEQAHTQFQLSVARKMLSGGLLDRAVNEPNLDSQSVQQQLENNSGCRLAFGKLKKNVASVRYPQGLPGTMPLSSNSSTGSKSNVPIVVYQENENEDQLVGTIQKCSLEMFPNSQSTHKENNMKAGTWNKSYNKKQVAATGAALLYRTPSTPSFKVHEDADCEATTPARPLTGTFNVLKTKRVDTFNCPMAIFEPPDPSVKPMYCKQKIYAGGREFQLEEIRAAIYNKNYYKKLQKEEVERLGLPWIMETPEVTSTPMVNCLARRQHMASMTNHMTPFNTGIHTRTAGTSLGIFTDTNEKHISSSGLCITPGVSSSYGGPIRGSGLPIGKLDFQTNEEGEEDMNKPNATFPKSPVTPLPLLSMETPVRTCSEVSVKNEFTTGETAQTPCGQNSESKGAERKIIFSNSVIFEHGEPPDSADVAKTEPTISMNSVSCPQVISKVQVCNDDSATDVTTELVSRLKTSTFSIFCEDSAVPNVHATDIDSTESTDAGVTRQSQISKNINSFNNNEHTLGQTFTIFCDDYVTTNVAKIDPTTSIESGTNKLHKTSKFQIFNDDFATDVNKPNVSRTKTSTFPVFCDDFATADFTGDVPITPMNDGLKCKPKSASNPQISISYCDNPATSVTDKIKKMPAKSNKFVVRCGDLPSDLSSLTKVGKQKMPVKGSSGDKSQFPLKKPMFHSTKKTTGFSIYSDE